MISSKMWWERTKASPLALEAWLFDQYRGESSAAGRIEALRDAFAPAGSRAFRVLTVIAEQERRHARWVGALLEARGLAPRIEEKAERYWPAVADQVADLETGAAVGAHAEVMRLERIEVIAADCAAPSDVHAVFARILPEERFHARAFAALAGEAALMRTAAAHDLGMALLGLAP